MLFIVDLSLASFICSVSNYAFSSIYRGWRIWEKYNRQTNEVSTISGQYDDKWIDGILTQKKNRDLECCWFYETQIITINKRSFNKAKLIVYDPIMAKTKLCTIRFSPIRPEAEVVKL